MKAGGDGSRSFDRKEHHRPDLTRTKKETFFQRYTSRVEYLTRAVFYADISRTSLQCFITFCDAVIPDVAFCAVVQLAALTLTGWDTRHYFAPEKSRVLF